MRVLFGSQWDAAVDPARVLCLGAIAGSLMAFASQALLATGDARRLLWFQVFALAARVVLALLGAMQGLLGLAIALALGSILSTTALVWMLRRAIGLSVADLNTVIGKSGALALIAVSPALLLVLLVGAEPDQPFLTLAASVPLVAAAFLAGALWLRHPIGEELARAWLKFRAAA
jgi:O-antigen/teichoic acid export membrane protein